MAKESGDPPIDRWISLGASIVAPVTLLSALLFYFGYASTRATYEFFGVDVDTVGLGTRDYVMRSPQPLLVPLVGLLLLGALGVWLHIWVRSSLHRRDRRLTEAIRRSAGAIAAVGALLLGVVAVLVVIFPAAGDWDPYDLVTPVCLGAGIALLAYGRHVLALSQPDHDTPDGRDGDRQGTGLRRLSTILVLGVIAGSIFWATATLAEWSGRGQAERMAHRFSQLPLVILDTKERLYVHDPVIEETELPAEEGQEFRYRYRQLRLLIEGGERMFLVPNQWSRSGTTLVVPFDESVRVQFQFENPG